MVAMNVGCILYTRDRCNSWSWTTQSMRRVASHTHTRDVTPAHKEKHYPCCILYVYDKLLSEHVLNLRRCNTPENPTLI